jgi:hypothetical protein
MSKTLLSALVFFISLHLAAQDNSSNMPPVTVADFSPVSPLVDSGTDAVILVDSGSSTIDANPQDGFFVNYFVFRRILIRKKTILDEVSKISIPFSVELNGKKLKNVKAFTYNIVNGHVSKVAVQDDDLFVDDSKNDRRTEKFAFPNARDGSIIEYQFSEKIDTYNLIDWDFQAAYPVLKSMYSVQVPDGFNYSIEFQNKKYLFSTVAKTFVKTLYAWTNFENTTIHDITWTYENIPPMREEVFTSTIKNYIGCVKFQPSAIPTQPGTSKGVWNEWPWYAKLLLQSYDFGKAMDDPSTMIKSQAKLFAGDNNTDLQKAKGIYAGVRDHFKVNGRGLYMRDGQNLSTIYNAATGNVAEINIILIAMLRSQKIKTDPVILATRDKGLTNQQYPILKNYNYLICRAVIDGKEYFLDASSSFMTFGKLPSACYNGHARAITKETYPVFLAPDSVKEFRHVVANIYNAPNSKNLNLEWTDHMGSYESFDLHDDLNNKKQETLFKSLTESVPFKKSLDSFSISNLKNMEEPLNLYYKMSLDPGNGERIYFDPMLNNGLSENPFKTSTRSYPVEFSYVLNRTYELNMEIPAGYEIEELPKSQKMILNETDGSYEYRVQVTSNTIKLKTTFILSKAIYEPEDYNSLRDFYAAIIKKQGDVIVFKKKS